MKLLKNYGLSLIEVLVATGVLGLIGMTVMNITQNMADQRISSSWEQEINLTMRELYLFFQKRQNCDETFTLDFSGPVGRVKTVKEIVESSNLLDDIGFAVFNPTEAQTFLGAKQNIGIESLKYTEKNGSLELNFTFVQTKLDPQDPSKRIIDQSYPKKSQALIIPAHTRSHPTAPGENYLQCYDRDSFLQNFARNLSCSGNNRILRTGNSCSSMIVGEEEKIFNHKNTNMNWFEVLNDLFSN